MAIVNANDTMKGGGAAKTTSGIDYNKAKEAAAAYTGPDPMKATGAKATTQSSSGSAAGVKNSGINWVDALTYAANANQNAGYATPPQQVKAPEAKVTSEGIGTLDAVTGAAPSKIQNGGQWPNKDTETADANNNQDGGPKPGGDKPTVDPNAYNGYGNGSGNGSGGGSGSSGGGNYNGTGYSEAELLSQALKAAGVTADPYQLPTIDGPNPERLQHVDTTELQNLLQQIVDTQKQQGNAQIDYGVEQGVNELTRAMEDAALQSQTQRDQATADELRALDNQALYAEARGDRGGIGEAQYASIQNTAAQNRRAVNDAQTKLGTDTARQIADLRSQGEFKKADQLLSITQSYLKDLMGLEQWALEANMSVDQFNSQLQQWVDEYNLNVQKFLTDLDLSASQLTGVFANGNQTAAAKKQLNESLASSGSALLSAGVLPSRQQLEAMGMTETQAKAYIKKISG